MIFRLISSFRVRSVYRSCTIVPFIDQNSAFVLYPIGVGSTRSKTHQDNAVGTPQSEVHATLEIHADCGAHCGVGNHITGLEVFRQGDWIIDASSTRYCRTAARWVAITPAA